MSAFLLLIIAVVSRVMPHPAWFNLTAVGGSLLYFGARRPLREMLIPVAVLAAVDYYLTVGVYHYSFVLSGYLLTWAWYAAMVVLGRILLRERAGFTRVIAAVVIGPTSFFLLSNYATWVVARDLYPRSFSGLLTCYVAALPFYRNDLIGTALVAGLVFGVPAVVRRLNGQTAQVAAR